MQTTTLEQALRVSSIKKNLKALKSSNEVRKSEACAEILALANNFEAERHGAKKYIVKGLAALLSYPDTAVRKQAAIAIGHLVSGNVKNQNLMQKLGVIDSLKACRNDADQEMQEIANNVIALLSLDAASSPGGGGAGRDSGSLVAPENIEHKQDDDLAPAASELKPKHIIMIDHGGVLDFATRNVKAGTDQYKRTLRRQYIAADVDSIIKRQKIQPTDFLLPTIKSAQDIGRGDVADEDNVPVMPDGAATIKLLNFLAAQPGVILVFHSKNKAADQQHLIQQIKTAIGKHNEDNRDNLVYPNFAAMVDADADKYSGVSPSKPDCNYSVEYGVQVIGYDANQPCDGKSSVRQAIASVYNIDVKERANHHVLDDGGSNIRAAIAEGYCAYRIGEDHGCVTLLESLKTIAQAINPQAYADFMHAQEQSSALAAPAPVQVPAPAPAPAQARTRYGLFGSSRGGADSSVGEQLREPLFGGGDDALMARLNNTASSTSQMSRDDDSPVADPDNSKPKSCCC